MASERRTEAKAKAATGPPVIAERYEVPVEAVFVKRWRTEVVTRDMLVFPYGEGVFYCLSIHIWSSGSFSLFQNQSPADKREIIW